MARSPEFSDKTDEAARPPPQPPGKAPTLEPNEARQGVAHKNVRFVLAVGLIGAIIAMVIAYLWFFGGGAPR